MKYFTHKKRRLRKGKSLKRLSRRKKARMTKKKIGGQNDEEVLKENLIAMGDSLPNSIKNLFKNKGIFMKIGKYWYKVTNIGNRIFLIGAISIGIIRSTKENELFYADNEEDLNSVINFRILNYAKSRPKTIEKINGKPYEHLTGEEYWSLPKSIRLQYRPDIDDTYVLITDSYNVKEQLKDEEKRKRNGPLYTHEYQKLSEENKLKYKEQRDKYHGITYYIKKTEEDYKAEERARN